MNVRPTAICSGQNLTIIRIVAHVPNTKNFPQEFHIPQSPTRILRHIDFLEGSFNYGQPPPHPIFSEDILLPEDPPISEPPSATQDFYLLKIFPTTKSSNSTAKALVIDYP